MNIESIIQKTQKILCDESLYKETNFFNIPHKKISLAIIKDITKLSYQNIGSHFNQSWFSIYKSVKDVKQKHNNFYTKILKQVKKII